MKDVVGNHQLAKSLARSRRRCPMFSLEETFLMEKRMVNNRMEERQQRCGGRSSVRIAPSQGSTAALAAGRLRPLPLPGHPEAPHHGGCQGRVTTSSREAWAADQQDAAVVALARHFGG
uniref:Uncharacterized protein n=1 Tax=Arundo donax TaxID=35708 RepID=A0A0A9BZB0_ARUDO